MQRKLTQSKRYVNECIMQARQVNQHDFSCVYRCKLTRHEFNSTNYTINRPRQTSWVIIYLKKANSGDFKHLIGSGNLVLLPGMIPIKTMAARITSPVNGKQEQHFYKTCN